jgi:hypothetical protein
MYYSTALSEIIDQDKNRQQAWCAYASRANPLKLRFMHSDSTIYQKYSEKNGVCTEHYRLFVIIPSTMQQTTIHIAFTLY